VPAPSQLVPAGFSLAAVLAWGTSDFVGGYTVRRCNAFLFSALVHATGAFLVLSLARLNHSAFPAWSSVEWALAAGFLVGLSLVAFYRALAAGRMGLTAPITAILGAAIPAAAGMITDGLPGPARTAGFLLAGAGIWLISRSEDGGRPEGLGLAVLSGIGFAGFFLCLKQAGNGSALWIAGLSRLCSLAVTGTVVLFHRSFREITPRIARLGFLAGLIDVSGSVLFIRAAQTGRLDSVVVLSSLYPAVTVLWARLVLKERFSGWKIVGVAAALLAVPLIALR
jgi:drug/metabolite transporter (DMT)-like permease